MVKRIMSGVFALAALGALGVIIGGALASGEQLIVRFLTAVMVAALALYVVSDLRLKSQDSPTSSKAEGDDGDSDLPPNDSFDLLPDSDLPVSTTMFDGRDLQPAARTIDVIHPPTPPLPATANQAANQAAATTDLSESDPSPVAVEPGPTVTAGATTVDLDTPDVGTDYDYDADDTIQVDAVYVAVGNHSYEGSLDADAGDWPLRSDPGAATDLTESAPSESDALAGSTAAETTSPVLSTSSPVNGSITADIALTGIRAGDREQVTESPDSLTAARGSTDDDAHDQINETATVIDLARTTAYQADPVATPVIDLREPVTEDMPVSRSTVNINSHPVRIVDDQPMQQMNPPTPPMPPAHSGPSITPDAFAHNAESGLEPPVREPSGHGAKVAAAIAGGEQKVIETLIRQGMLSTDGPISDRDVRTMVYVAFTSNELRKIILSRGQVDLGDQSPDQSLGPVELFDESVFQPVPRRLYTGKEPASLPKPADAGLLPVTRSGERHDAPV